MDRALSSLSRSLSRSPPRSLSGGARVAPLIGRARRLRAERQSNKRIERNTQQNKREAVRVGARRRLCSFAKWNLAFNGAARGD